MAIIVDKTHYLGYLLNCIYWANVKRLKYFMLDSILISFDFLIKYFFLFDNLIKSYHYSIQFAFFHHFKIAFRSDCPFILIIRGLIQSYHYYHLLHCGIIIHWSYLFFLILFYFAYEVWWFHDYQYIFIIAIILK